MKFLFSIIILIFPCIALAASSSPATTIGLDAYCGDGWLLNEKTARNSIKEKQNEIKNFYKNEYKNENQATIDELYNFKFWFYFYSFLLSLFIFLNILYIFFAKNKLDKKTKLIKLLDFIFILIFIIFVYYIINNIIKVYHNIM